MWKKVAVLLDALTQFVSRPPAFLYSKSKYTQGHMTLFRSVLNKRSKADFAVGNIYIFYQYFEGTAFLLQGATYSDGVGVFFWQCFIVLVSIISFFTVVLTALMILFILSITNRCFIKLYNTGRF